MMRFNELHDVLGPLTEMSWDDLDGIAHASTEALASLRSHPTVLQEALIAVPQRPNLRALCEHYDILDKIVLYDEAGVRLRVHVFLPGHFDRPHNHRWTYTTVVLRGSYRHYLYGADEDLHEGMDVSELRPRLIRYEAAGSSYTLHHSMVHAVVAEPYTVSLVLRGPSQKDRFLVMDRTTGDSWWQHGAANEAMDEARAKRMDDGRLAATIDELNHRRVFCGQPTGDPLPSAGR